MRTLAQPAPWAFSKVEIRDIIGKALGQWARFQVVIARPTLLRNCSAQP